MTGRRSRAAFGFGIAVAVAGASLALRAASVEGKDPPVAAPAPDLAFFAKKIAPFVEERCASCHATGAGALALRDPSRPSGDASARTVAAFRAVKRFLDAEAPWNSRLLKKLLPEDEGGLPHGGGPFLRAADDLYDDLLDFAAGATSDNLPPEPEPGKDRRIVLGDVAPLDGSLSYDRDDDRLTFRWTLVSRPPESRAALADADAPKASVRADVPGTYVVTLRVFDGKLWSGARPVVLECLDRAGPVRPDAAAASGLAGVAPDALRRLRAVYGDVLARPPTPPEILAAKDRSTSEVADVLLSTLEAGSAFAEDVAWRLSLVGDGEPLSGAVEALPRRIAAGELSPAAAEAVLVRDPSFLRVHPPGPALAAAVGALLLERSVSPDETLAFASPAALEGVLASPEFELAALRRLARRFLRPSDADAVPAARARESLVALARSFVASPSYAGAGVERRRSGDLAFVRALFADLLGRRPTSKERVAAASAAAVLRRSSAGRAAVVDVVLDSGEVPLPLIVDLGDPDAWIADRFLRYVGRTPSAAEAKAYHGALMDPDGGPHVVIRALLSGAEYASR